ncbi:MAG: TIGR01212 family radical SAM protein [Clostridia bacterium]|nr:TIGR01212 family radical SAM protein [Clostridia bacterium]
MKNKTQRDTNPYKYSDSNKRYQTFDYYLRREFGEKCAKVSLDAGLTCPNIDGAVSYGGCIYCRGGSSGAASATSISGQYRIGKEIMTRKWDCSRFIPYLQAHTNTYAPVDVLKKIYDEASSLDGAVMLGIATRADCLPGDVLELLFETSKKIPLMIELGLQTTNDATASAINRGHSFDDFKKGYDALRGAVPEAKVAIHLIDGLPRETKEDMIKSAKDVAALSPDVVKLHVLYVLEGTPLASMFERGEYAPMELHDYVETVCDQLEILPPACAIGRVTGDAPEDELISPLWCRKKTVVANEIDKELFRRGTYQGIYYKN